MICEWFKNVSHPILFLSGWQWKPEDRPTFIDICGRLEHMLDELDEGLICKIKKFSDELDLKLKEIKKEKRFEVLLCYCFLT